MIDMVILQGFYWDCMKNWWKKLIPLADKLSNKGFDSIWLPPMTRGMNGEHSMGYDIKSHYNFNTKFGNKNDLINLINNLHENNINIIADVVMGHMMGGELEYNPILSNENEVIKTWTKFTEDEFPKNYKHFHYNEDDINEFGKTINYYNDNEYMKKGLIKWSNYLLDIGFDGFRVDNCKDINWDFLKKWKEKFKPQFTMGELWDGDNKYLDSFYNKTNIQPLNFPLFYSLKEMCMNTKYDIRILEEIINKYPNRINFVSNHDIARSRNGTTEDIVDNKELAYAYIMFQELPVIIFWKDYFDYNLKEKIDKLIKIYKNFKSSELLYISRDLYVKEKGNYILLLNTGDVKRKWNNNIINSQSYKII